MIQISSGQMICDIRTTVGVRQEELCHGLCTVSALSKYESGERIPDNLLFHALLQRLGKSPGRINIMISKEDAAYYEWKVKVQDELQAGNWEELPGLLEEGRKKNSVINEVLQRQYELYLEAVIARRIEKDDETFYTCIREAVLLTIPEAENWRPECGMLGSDEINLLFLYLYGQRILGIRSDSEIRKTLEEVGRYIEERVDDVFEKAKIYPRLVCVKDWLVRDTMKQEERIWQAKKAFGLLKRTYDIYDLPEILKILCRELGEKGEEEAGIYEKQREALVSVMETYGFSPEICLESWYGGNERVYLVNEYLRAEREEKKLTQEQLSEGVCEVETYSRIENGKRSPSVKNFRKLAEKLDMHWGYYSGQIVTTHFKDFDLMTEQRLAMNKEEWEKAERLLDELSQRLDMGNKDNRQYIGMTKIHIKRMSGEVTPEEQLEACYRILGCTEETIYARRSFFSKTEMELILLIADGYRHLDKYQQALNLLNCVLENSGRRKFSSWYETGTLKRIRAGVYGDMGDASNCVQEAENCIREMLEAQHGQLLDACLNLVGWGQEMLGKSKKDYGDYYAKAFYISDLFSNKANCDFQRRIYEEHVGKRKKWY